MLILNILLHLFLRPAVYRAFDLDTVLIIIILNQLVCAETLLTLLTVHQWIRKSAQMAAGYPCLGIHQNRTVHSYVVWAFLNKLLPPGFLYIVFKLNTQIAVIPGICKTAVDLRTRVYKTSVLGKSYDFFHCLFHDPCPLFLYTYCQQAPFRASLQYNAAYSLRRGFHCMNIPKGTALTYIADLFFRGNDPLARNTDRKTCFL